VKHLGLYILNEIKEDKKYFNILPSRVNILSYYLGPEVILMVSNIAGLRYRVGFALPFPYRCWQKDLCYPSTACPSVRSQTGPGLALAPRSGVVSPL